jgi:hypothetical protein
MYRPFVSVHWSSVHSKLKSCSGIANPEITETGFQIRTNKIWFIGLLVIGSLVLVSYKVLSFAHLHICTFKNSP